MRRGIAAVRRARIVGVSFPGRADVKPLSVTPARATFRRRLRGATIEDVGRAGKRVVLGLSSGDRLVFEPRMTGLVLLGDPPSAKHLRLRLELEAAAPGGPDALLFWDRRGLGTLSLLDPEEYARRLGPDQLGPDALGVDARLLRERLGASRRPIKVALLDQRVLAGVGNIYASEALHVARIAPDRPCAELRPAELRALGSALRGVLTDAIRYEGSTLNDGTYRNALNEEGGYQAHHRVYARAGKPCHRCGGEVERAVQAQRATFFCRGCQR